MGLKPGMTNNPNGRPKGSINKEAAELRQKLNDFLNDNWEKVQKDYDELEPKERLRFYERLLPYRLPLLQRTEYVNDFDVTQMSNSEIDIIINKIIANEQNSAT